MSRVTSNMEQVVRRQQQMMQDMIDPDKILRTAAFNGMALVSNRIQQKGELTAGGKIGGGNYSPGYEKFRQKKGRQTSLIDLTMQGDMMMAFTVVKNGKVGFSLGFSNDREYEKMKWNEDRFGVFIQLSKAEADLCFKDILNDIDNVLRTAN